MNQLPYRERIPGDDDGGGTSGRVRSAQVFVRRHLRIIPLNLSRGRTPHNEGIISITVNVSRADSGPFVTDSWRGLSRSRMPRRRIRKPVRRCRVCVYVCARSRG
ncbi:hypothetical protein ISCGN_031949 [Ixodes scapularis]